MPEPTLFVFLCDPLKPLLIICMWVCLYAPAAKNILLECCLVSSAALENENNIRQPKAASLTELCGMSLPALLPNLGTPFCHSDVTSLDTEAQTNLQGKFHRSQQPLPRHFLTQQLAGLRLKGRRGAKAKDSMCFFHFMAHWAPFRRELPSPVRE